MVSRVISQISRNPPPSIFSTDFCSKLEPSNKVTILTHSVWKATSSREFCSVSPQPSEEEVTHPADGEDDTVGGNNNISANVRSNLSIPDLVKLVAEKDKLLVEKQKEIDKMQDKFFQTHVEIEKQENLLDKTKEEAADLEKVEVQKFAKSLLYVADNLERASKVVKDSLSTIDPSRDAAGALPVMEILLERVQMTEKQLREALPSFTYAENFCRSSVVIKNPRRVEKYYPIKVEQYIPRKIEKYYPK